MTNDPNATPPAETTPTLEVLPPETETKDSATTESFPDMMRKAAESAKQAAHDAMPKVKELAGKAAYGAAYAASYGTTLLGGLAKEILPDSLKKAFKDGVEQAKSDSQPKPTPVPAEPEVKPAE
jgi:DNA-binding protein YbaB